MIPSPSPVQVRQQKIQREENGKVKGKNLPGGGGKLRRVCLCVSKFCVMFLTKRAAVLNASCEFKSKFGGVFKLFLKVAV